MIEMWIEINFLCELVSESVISVLEGVASEMKPICISPGIQQAYVLARKASSLPRDGEKDRETSLNTAGRKLKWVS